LRVCCSSRGNIGGWTSNRDIVTFLVGRAVFCRLAELMTETDGIWNAEFCVGTVAIIGVAIAFCIGAIIVGDGTVIGGITTFGDGVVTTVGVGCGATFVAGIVTVVGDCNAVFDDITVMVGLVAIGVLILGGCDEVGTEFELAIFCCGCKMDCCVDVDDGETAINGGGDILRDGRLMTAGILMLMGLALSRALLTDRKDGVCCNNCSSCAIPRLYTRLTRRIGEIVGGLSCCASIASVSVSVVSFDAGWNGLAIGSKRDGVTGELLSVSAFGGGVTVA
jgi:hypothetical protein